MDSNLLFSHVTAAAMFVMVMQQLKKASWFPWLKNEGQLWLKRGSSIVYAIGAHTGITQAWHAGPTQGSHVLMITIPAFSVMAVTLWRMGGQYAFQEIIYQAAVKSSPSALPAPAIAAPAVRESPVTNH